MNKDRFNFRIAVFERCNTDEWEFTKFIEKTDKFGVSTNGNVIQENVQGYIIHLTREKTPKNVYRTMEALQCTGIKDKNGKLIYEGDIVRLFCDEFENIHTVKFGDFAMYSLDFQTEYEKGSTAVYGYYLDGLKYPIPLSISLDTSGMQIEVIGNIYENKNLLERM